MNYKSIKPNIYQFSILMLIGCLMLASAASAQDVILNVNGTDGQTFDFRWLVQEDVTYQHNPATPDQPDILGLNFHKSYIPLVSKGTGNGSASITDLDPDKAYFVSVLPSEAGTYGLGGGRIKAGQSEVSVVLDKMPIPTAQISIFVFEDTNPINNAPDLPQERGLEGFTITLEEPGGRYGAAGGPISRDAFGNALGTTYNADGTVDVPGTGVLTTNADGVIVIKNLPPAKYGILVAPPLGTNWMQTSTIEGSKVIDAWVKADEPPYFTEFGPAGHHADFGFIRPMNTIAALPNPGGQTGSISGQVVNTHMSRPPNYTFYPGAPFPDAWVGLNTVSGEGVYAQPCDGSSQFTISSIPAGTYELVAWDKNLDIVFASQNVTIPDANGSYDLDLGTVGVFNWFSRLKGKVFFDTNSNGFPDAGEQGIPDQAVNIRWRDGTLYQSVATDNAGEYAFDEVFPFFNWLVAEVDFARFKATGMTAVVDAGGEVLPDQGWGWPSDSQLTPQAQPENNGLPYRVEQGAVLTQAFQGFLGQTNMIYWGKNVYDASDPLDNGGISGMVFYDTTRAEDDPQFNFGEEWQPGIPRVQVNLYRDDNADGLVDDIDGSSIPVNFNNYAVDPYGTTQNQDVDSVVTVEDNGQTLRIVGNGWKKIAFSSPLTITADTVIAFDFESNAEGEIHGIGFDTDDDQSDNQTFQLYGTQTWSIQDFNTYADGDGRTHYEIPVGQFFTGDFDFLTFVMDHDVANPAGESYFSNIIIYESTDSGAGIQLADVDNYPFGWNEGGAKGDEDVDRNDNGVFDQGDALDVAWTDSWDDSLPENCPGDPSDPFYMNGKCYDGLRNFNQVRPGVFDGGFAFTGIETNKTYIVEAVPPPLYEIVRSQDRNVDFGDEYRPGELALPPPCVGPDYVVPAELTLFPGEPAPLAGQKLKHCNMKQVFLAGGLKNTPAEFFMFTDVPVAAHVQGFILDDLSNEFNPANPNFGEKFAPPNLPIAFYDYLGNEITRIYSDRHGNYNGVLPSTFTTNVGSPSGMGPNMLTACMNDPGPILNPDTGEYDIDPYFNTQYTQFCYTFQYMPGVTTYLDTPVLPIAAYAGPSQAQLDCEFPNKTPVIYSVSSNSNGVGGGPYTKPGKVLKIISVGRVDVPNPAYTPDNGEPRLIKRDYRFGPASSMGEVWIGDAQLQIVQWSPRVIKARVPNNAETGQLVVIRGDNGVKSPMAVTVTVDPNSQQTVHSVPGSFATIQQAVDTASPGDLILVAPGVYEELVIMYKPVKIQGWGAPSVIINAVKRPGEKLAAWRAKVQAIVNANMVTLLPGQALGMDPANNEPGFLASSEGPGILVMGKDANPVNGGFDLDYGPRIDGITITGADIGGGIVVNGYAQYLEISNNRIMSNEGHTGGGIQIGHPFEGDTPVDARNDYISIRRNQIMMNGSPNGYPGGIAIFTGADRYEVADNHICGNYSTGSGGGIGHIGLSRNGVIANNDILFNQSFNQQPGDIGGGGIAIEGARSLNAQLTAGSGTVLIEKNRIQGNAAGAGDGGGIRLAYVNGADVMRWPNRPGRWYEIIVVNNIIDNNVTGLAGGGISLLDTLRAWIVHNTIAHNDSTATASGAFIGDPNVSNAQPAGVISRRHSPDLLAVLPGGQELYSKPMRFHNNIVWKNRSFYWDALVEVNGIAVGGLVPNLDGLFQDLAVLGVPGARLNPRKSVLTDKTGYHNNNITADPQFVEPYFNGGSGLNLFPENSTPLSAAALDEGGNFIDVRIAPLSPVGNYHIEETSPAVDGGNANLVNISKLNLTADFDDEDRPQGSGVDMGADEVK